MRLSTPIRYLLKVALRSLPIALVALSVVCAPGAIAAECAEEADAGICLDDETFQWCSDGELKMAKCPEGQICVDDHPWYEGSGCVASNTTACGDIPPQGECTTANSVAWCDEGVPRVQPCDDDSVCAWDDENGWYDCLPSATNAPNAPNAGPDASFDDDSIPSDDAATEDDGEAMAPPEEDIGPEPSDDDTDEFSSGPPGDADEEFARGDAPTPTVTTGAADTEATAPTGPGGCHGGSSPSIWSVLLLLALAFNGRRRERNGAAA